MTRPCSHGCSMRAAAAPGRSSPPASTAGSGDQVAFALRAGHAGHCGAITWSVERARRYLRDTQQFWWRWVAKVRYDGPYQPHVWRSALALKLMTYSPTGAIIAAPTTSLP